MKKGLSLKAQMVGYFVLGGIIVLASPPIFRLYLSQGIANLSASVIITFVGLGLILQGFRIRKRGQSI